MKREILIGSPSPTPLSTTRWTSWTRPALYFIALMAIALAAAICLGGVNV